ncbi:MAG: helicase [Chloroflexi bacterium]|nr:helicase [Chloroflexota bacterium]
MSEEERGRLFYHRLPDFDRKETKLDYLSDNSLSTVDWQRLVPNTKHTWRRTDTEDEFDSYIPIGSKGAPRSRSSEAEVLFSAYGPAVLTSRDMYVYAYSYDQLSKRTKQLVRDYNAQVAEFQQNVTKPDVDEFVDVKRIKWSATLKQQLKRGYVAAYFSDRLRNSLYRPFTKKYLYYDKPFVDRPGQLRFFLPDENIESENRVLILTDVAYRSASVSALIVNSIPSLSLLSTTDSHQCFPFYTYDEDGSNRRENITDWALSQFRRHYHDPAISKWDIFYYVYGLLHHPGYCERYALDLKRSLPRIPFAPARASENVGATYQVARDATTSGFWPFSRAGRRLADLHLNYESADRYELDWQSARKPVSYRVEKMLPKGKVDSAEGNYKVYSTLKYNDTLTLNEIPERAFAYRLGNRSALDWIVDQYRVKSDKRSGITHDPNGYSDDPQYILKLIERVIAVSLRTVDIVEELAKLPFRDESAN